MARTLKVFRTSTGFHDAYVAAPSRAAALRAWGSANDLFARGGAEEITDPALMKEPLDRPGEVIRKSRGSIADQLAALPPDQPRSKASPPTPPQARTRKPRPRPSRAKLDKAEAEAKSLTSAHRQKLAELESREADLRRERRTLEACQTKEREKANRTVEKARSAYDGAVERWRAAD